MSTQTPGKIFLADERGLTRTARFQRYSTFSHEEFEHAHKQPFGPLYALNEVSLAGGQALTLDAPEASYLVLLPITGALTLHTAPGTGLTVDVEELYVAAVPAGGQCRVVNPYDAAVVSFLQLWLKADPAAPLAPAHYRRFTAATITNRLATLEPVDAAAACPFRLSLGQFAGRREAVYAPAPGSQVFVCVIAGAFEVEGRLLHEKDGLGLWDAPAVELEALSNNALVLLVELEPTR